MSPRVLFVGDMWHGSNALSLANGFQSAGANVLVVDTSHISNPTRFGPAWAYRKASRRAAPWSLLSAHNDLEQIAERFKPDMLFCFKAISLNQDQLLALPASVRVHYSPDDVSNPVNTSEDYLARECDWDTIVTTKTHNIPELKARGVHDVLHVWSAYDPTWHFPHANKSEHRFAAGFIGVRRPDRERLMLNVADRYGDQLLVCGPGWNRMPNLRRAATVERAKYGQSFSEAMGRIAGNLVLLNSDNRDTHTCRSLEVPAAGGLVVGERTDEHLALLEEEAEALFFSSEDELIEILDRCQKGDEELKRIARRGCLRIRQSEHTYADRAKTILEHVSLPVRDREI